MTKRDLIARELEGLGASGMNIAAPMLAAQSTLAKDWLTPEEDAAWANL